LLLRSRFGQSNIYLLPVFQRISRIHNHLITRLQPTKDFDGAAVVASDGHGTQLDLLIRIDHSGPWTFRTEEQSIDRNRQSGSVDLRSKVHLSISSRKNFSSRIGNFDFSKQSPRRRIDYLRSSYDLSFKPLPGILSLLQRRLHADMNERAVGLGHTDVNAQRIDLGNVEQFFVRAHVARINECSDIDVALGQYP